jgi:hypothetical protein
VGILWIDDGRDPCDPVDRRRGYDVLAIDVYDKRMVQRHAFVTNRGSVRYSEARQFLIIPPYGGQSFIVHRDRMILFGGAKTASLEKEANVGWDYSIYQAALRYVRGFNNGYSAVENMIQDASQGVSHDQRCDRSSHVRGWTRRTRGARRNVRSLSVRVPKHRARFWR